MKSLFSGPLVALILLLTAGSASAFTYCVGDGVCGGSTTYPRTADGLQDAVDQALSVASPGFDQILVAPGPIELPDAGISVDPGTGQDITIEGAGVDKTIFHSATPNARAFNLFGVNADVAFSDATIKVDGPGSSQRKAIEVNTADIDRVKFEVTSIDGTSTLGLYGSAICHYCEFVVSGNGAEAGYSTGGLTLHNSKAYTVGDPSGTIGFREGGGGTLQIFSSTISDFQTGTSTDNGTLYLSNSVIDMGDISGAHGMIADNANAGTNAIGAYSYSSTIVGTGENQRSVIGDANVGQSLNLYVRDSIVLTTASSSKDMVCTGPPSGNANLTINFSLYYASHFTFDPNCNTSTASPNSAEGYALADIFVSPATGDFRLKPPVSPAINPAFDTGNTGTVCTQAFDLIGNVRCINATTLLPESGKIDVGAVEYQNYKPDQPVLTAPAGGQAGASLGFAASGFDANGNALTYKWKFGDGQEGAGASTSHSYVAPGTYTVEVRSNDGASDSDPATASVTITAQPIVAPTTLLLKANGKVKFKKGAKLKNGFKSATKKPKAAYVLATASAAIAGTIKLYNAKGKALKGSQKITLKAGKSYLTFGGKWNKKALAKGKYTLRFSSSSLQDTPKAVLSIVR